MLITRQAEEGARTAALVEARGFLPVSAPFLVVRHRRVAVPARAQAILVTSGNALAAIAPRSVALLTVGDATAAKARNAGFLHVRSAGGDAAALAVCAARELRPRRGPLLLASGARQGFSLAATLRAAGFTVVRRTAYEAVPVTIFPETAASALHANTLHAAMFLSAETAAAFVRTCPTALHQCLRNVLALTIGKPAADALDGLPWRQVRLAHRPTLDDVLALL